MATPGTTKETPFSAADCPVIQVVFGGSSRDAWAEGTHGLSAKDIAMNVALPEVDGRLLSRAVSFKGAARRDETTQCDVVRYEPVPDRVVFVAALAARWARLRRKPAVERKVALVLANYPNRDGRLGNGVGLDSPEAAAVILSALADAGYGSDTAPATGQALIEHLRAGPTNDLTARSAREIRTVLQRDAYERSFAALPETVREAVTERWGAPQDDPFFLTDRDGFALALSVFGNAAVGIQPARGYNIDPVSSYHDPALIPPHGYLAFYIWLREVWGRTPSSMSASTATSNGCQARPWPCPSPAFRGRVRPPAAPLSVHRQRSRRRNPGQTTNAGGHPRPPHPAAHPRGKLRSAQGLGGSG